MPPFFDCGRSKLTTENVIKSRLFCSGVALSWLWTRLFFCVQAISVHTEHTIHKIRFQALPIMSDISGRLTDLYTLDTSFFFIASPNGEPISYCVQGKNRTYKYHFCLCVCLCANAYRIFSKPTFLLVCLSVKKYNIYLIRRTKCDVVQLAISITASTVYRILGCYSERLLNAYNSQRRDPVT